MSEVKKRKRIAREIRKAQGALPRLFDPAAWLVTNGHAKTKKEARELILADRLTVDDEPIGKTISLVQVGNDVRAQNAAADRMDIELRDKLVVKPAEEKAEVPPEVHRIRAAMK